MTVARINEILGPLDLEHRNNAMGGPIIWFHGQVIIFFGQFWKLGFCLVSECEIYAHGGQLRILLDREYVASVSTWNMPKILAIPTESPF